MRLAFVALALFLFFIQLLPLQTEAPGRIVGPDALMLFAFAWAVRRPEFLPAGLLAGVFLLADLLLQRPPGLWAVLMLLACERLKAQSVSLRDAGFATECLTVGLLIGAVFLGYRVLMMLFILDAPPLGLWIVQLIVTLACYPLAVFLTHWLMGVRKYAPGDLGPGGLSA